MPGHSGGLTKWFKEGWVDISRPRKGGGYAPCGRKSARKIQILTVGEQRARVMGKKTVASIFKSAKAGLRKAHNARTQKKKRRTKKRGR